jgi:hypothetical protein
MIVFEPVTVVTEGSMAGSAIDVFSPSGRHLAGSTKELSYGQNG